MATESHCIYCFDVLVAELNGDKTKVKAAFESAKYPLFVTWKIRDDFGDTLRGCIGTFSSVDLTKNLKVYSIESGFNDPRFEAIQENELSDLINCVSLLTDFEQADNYLDWEVGVHGIQIEFYDEFKIKRRSTFLPEVAVEQEWEKRETIDHLIRKAGYKAKITPKLRQSLKVVRYQSSKKQMTYAEYMAAKNN